MRSVLSFWLNLVKWLAWPKTARVLHVMHNDRFNRSFIDLVREHFGESNHLFLFYGGAPESDFKIPLYNNVIVLRGKEELRVLALLLRVARQTVFHGLLIHDLVQFLSRRTGCLRHSCWVTRGADLYPDKTVMDSDYFRAKKQVVQGLRGLGVVARGDFQIAQRLYDFKGACFHALYKNPIEKQWLDFSPATKPTPGHVTVQINNSADESVLGMLEELSRFKGKPLRIRVVLSYGNPALKNKILQTGREIFGGQFEPLTDSLSPREYARLIGQCDVLVMNQPRQQGLGNIYAFLYRGAKVYVRSDVSSWDFLREKGFEVFDTLNIPGQSFESFCAMSQAGRQNNRAYAAPLFDDDYIASLWSEIFARSGKLDLNQKPSSLALARQRRAREFDWRFYVSFYADLSGIQSETEALGHWLERGWGEGRIGGTGCEKFVSNRLRLNRYLAGTNANSKLPKVNGPLINILTRTNRRPLFFRDNRASVENQAYRNYRQLVSYENAETFEYLRKTTLPPQDLIKVARNGCGTHPYNLFVNALMEQVSEGWILFLDDDDLFTTPNALSVIASHLNDPETLVIWNMWFPDKIVPGTRNLSEILEGKIASSCFAFHSKHKQAAAWHSSRAGDYHCFDNLRKKLKPLFLDDILARTNYTDRSAGWGQPQDKGRDRLLPTARELAGMDRSRGVAEICDN